jgi:hypothetical protein
MHVFVYLVLAAVIYIVLADRTDAAADRELEKRRSEAGSLGLVEDFDVRPDLGPRYGRLLRRHAGQATASRQPADPPTSDQRD